PLIRPLNRSSCHSAESLRTHFSSPRPSSRPHGETSLLCFPLPALVIPSEARNLSSLCNFHILVFYLLVSPFPKYSLSTFLRIFRASSQVSVLQTKDLRNS